MPLFIVNVTSPATYGVLFSSPLPPPKTFAMFPPLTLTNVLYVLTDVVFVLSFTVPYALPP